MAYVLTLDKSYPEAKTYSGEGDRFLADSRRLGVGQMW